MIVVLFPHAPFLNLKTCTRIVHMYLYIRLHVHPLTCAHHYKCHVQMHLYMNVHVHVQLCMHLFICMLACVDPFTWIYIHVHAHICVHVHAHLGVNVPLCVHAHVHVHPCLNQHVPSS